MAKAPATAEQLPVPTEPTGGALSVVPDYLRQYTGPLGTENIDTDDVNIPRLKLGQSMTPEVKDQVVKDGDMFHSITKQVIIPVGERRIVIPVAYVKEFVLWRDRNDGGGIFARARRTYVGDEIKYAWDKPNTTFEHKIKGAVKVQWKTKQFIEDDGLGRFGSMIPGDRDSAPAATAHFNYIICLPEYDNQLLAISLNRSSAKKARDWNAMLKMGNIPMFARQFNLGAIPDQNDAGDKFYNYSITPAGFIQSQEMFDYLQGIHLEMAKSNITVDWTDEEGGSRPAGDDPEKF